MIRNTIDTYGLLTRFIHWITALLILGLLFIGFYMGTLPFNESKIKIIMLHKSFGLLVLMLVFVRVAWHILSRKPKSLDTHAPWEKFLAHIAHGFLYFAMFAMPITGWVMSSAGDFTVQFFGIKLPDLVEKNEQLFGISRQAHETIALIMIVVLGLHMAGAFKHHFIDRDKTLKRMTRQDIGFGGGALLVLVAAIMMLPTVFIVAQDILGEMQEQIDPIAASPVMADASEGTGWVIDERKSKIQFEAMQYGQSFEGRFESFGGQIFFDPSSLETSKALIKIQISSIKTGSADRDKQALGTDWFDSAQYPEAVFETQSFELKGENKYAAHGILTIRGIAIPLNFPFDLEIKNDGKKAHAKMKAELSLNRLDFGIGQGEWKGTEAIGNEVKIKIEVEADQ